ncbi:hypothetical protein EAX61_15505 [Dokdonia sinensis]|uniref:Uncharacterized protein n=1 Tax=Dokdonia sinensis TaxID=2479847 RepID=A0A3M0FU17_9FLAO|nr:contractile injection system tape measure protein [Dokdonia sinensis]RMB56174.1 hypothetical protein EAX61_15505 [Dokdonia sinensis]
MEETELIRVENAGLILVWPFLRSYFEQLGMLDGDNFKDSESQHRAVYLLQYLVYNEIDFSEYRLPLNKILVGMPLVQPVTPVASLTTVEIEISESLLNGFKANWSKLENSSLAAVQENFMQRDGSLSRSENGYSFKVESTTIDVLMHDISWSFSAIKLLWMQMPLYVDWI